MNIIYFELLPANKECQDSFLEIAKNYYDGMPIFEFATKYVNNSTSYARFGRKLEIVEISEHFLKVKLESESKLEMPSKALSGFTRELLRIDEILNPDSDKRFFKRFIYNRTLFRSVQVDSEKWNFEREEVFSDSEALKICVDLFAGEILATKEENALKEKYKTEIKETLKTYKSLRRVISYAVYSQKKRN